MFNNTMIVPKTKSILFTVTFFYLITTFILGGLELLIVCLSLVVILGIPFLLSLSSRYESMVYFAGTALLTQAITLPFFYTVRRDGWYLADFIDFDYSVLSASIPLLYVGVFLLMVRMMVWGWEKIYVPPALGYHQVRVNKTKNKLWYGLAIMGLILIFSPIQLWMFQEGIGLTGITPKRLPFKLTGVLYYLTKYLIPLIIGILYYKSSKSLTLTLLILFYGIYTSTFAASRGVGVLIIGVVMLIAWINKKYIALVIASVFLSLSFASATLMRNYTQYVVAGVPVSDISDFNIAEYADLFLNDRQSLPFLLIDSIISVVARISSFESLVQAIQYDAYQVNGGHPVDLVLKSFGRGFSVFDTDAHHLQWQGYVLPFGWYNGCTLYGDAVIIKNSGYFIWLILLAAVASFWLFLIEVLIKKTAGKYTISFAFTSIMILFFVLLYITNRGSSDILYAVYLLTIVVMIPKIIIARKVAYKK